MWITVDRKALVQALNFCTAMQSDSFFQFEAESDQLHVKSYRDSFYCWKLLNDVDILDSGFVKVNSQLLAVVKGLKDKQLMLKQASTYLEVSGLDSSQTFRVPIYSWDYKPQEIPVIEGTQQILPNNSLDTYFEVSSELNCVDSCLYLFQGSLALELCYPSQLNSALTNSVYKILKKYFVGVIRYITTDNQVCFESDDQKTMFMVNKTKINLDLFRQSSRLFQTQNKQFEMSVSSERLNLPVKNLISYFKILSKQNPYVLWIFEDNKLTFQSIERQKNELIVSCDYTEKSYKFVSSADQWLNLFKILDKTGSFSLAIADSQKLYFSFDDTTVIFSALSPKQVRM